MSRYLDMVDHPDHVKKLTLEQSIQLAVEIRHELITKLAKHGGHLGPNLGVVELSIALHRAFSTPKDKFVWDVSHQVYVHKLLTGRKNRFHTIRTTDGLNGFALRTESEHDCYGAGHAGTALSAALGMCAARDQRATDEHVVCVFGDAALTNGISFEALNNIAHTTKKFIGILNDNEWSIAKNVGAIAGYLSRLTSNPRYNQFQKDFASWLKRIPKGELAVRLGQKAEEALKGVVTDMTLQRTHEGPGTDGRGGYGSSLIFEEFGIKYLGPFDGHDLPTLVGVLEFAKTCEMPVVIHVLTQKGKGFEAAIKQPEKFHGLGPYCAETGAVAGPKPGTPPMWQDVFGRTMVKLCQQNKNVVGITAAMPSGTSLKLLDQAVPKQFYDVGIAEEHAVIFAAGMATMGFHPVVAIYSTFLQRAYDCIHHDVCLQDLPVIFCMDRSGLSANDGPTHHGLYDISYLRCLPNIILMVPKDEDEMQDMMFTATLQPHPVAIRYPRGPAEGVAIKDRPAVVEIGKAEVLKHFTNQGGRKVALFALGNMQSVARDAMQTLAAEGWDCALINPRFCKPLDVATHEFFARAADVVVTLEDHVLMGGYGSIVLETFSERRITTPVVRIGWPDAFVEHASSVDYLRAKHGLTAERLVQQVHLAAGFEAGQGHTSQPARSSASA
ncbi:MAG: 1-deoxy-D-xylulose-5-phosphate synthase [Verrucomicrobiales bacterium]|nr:1-deoxy-D-xylulose-5-phosphate synthase [Verrucomicrobiales bacterium]